MMLPALDLGVAINGTAVAGNPAQSSRALCRRKADTCGNFGRSPGIPLHIRISYGASGTLALRMWSKNGYHNRYLLSVFQSSSCSQFARTSKILPKNLLFASENL